MKVLRGIILPTKLSILVNPFITVLNFTNKGIYLVGLKASLS